jgi:hypothetical protein
MVRASRILSAGIWYLASRDSACTSRNALLQGVLAASVEPKHRAERAVVPSSELNRQLRLAYAAKSTEYEDLLSPVLPLWKERPFELRYLGWSVHKHLDSRDAFKAEMGSIFSNIYILPSARERLS